MMTPSDVEHVIERVGDRDLPERLLVVRHDHPREIAIEHRTVDA